AQLDKTDGRKVPVKRKCLTNTQRAHHREARGVHERVLALVVLTEPAQRLILEVPADELHAESHRASERIDESIGRCMAEPSVEKRPGLSANVVGREDAIVRLP